MKRTYDDIIHLPHHTSDKYPRMPRQDRAAQFSPFSALNGYEAAIAETARQTTPRIEVAEDLETALNQKLQYLNEIIGARPTVSITYFLPDSTKPGGSYQTVTGAASRINRTKQVIVLMDNTEIPLTDIIDLSFPEFSLYCE